MSIVVRTVVALLVIACVVSCRPKRGDGRTPGADEDGFSFHPSPPPPEEKSAEGEEKKPEKWNVEDPPGPKKAVKIDTDEGTWMSLSVSPDGKTIAFDLLGDLYTLPIAGGDAKPLTKGMAWDMQPAYSPDGKWIAFTSDRDGADNVWVIPAGGGEAKQVTKEDFRLVNSPAWSPDGQFIGVRKHFTKYRSLGSGEIWLYHLSGGKGLQMTEKPDDQKDVGEPAFSPDGKWVYFSRDMTPGRFFEYNKDPHAGIYAIRRMDRSDGRIETFVGGPGGAVRPTPSPNGKSLAFVRRVGLSTALFVHDIESGSERALSYDLDRDMQETWAIHGVYPTMAWTPDNESILYWAGGKIHRVDVKSATDAVIPFHVVDERTVVEALRPDVKAFEKSFHTKMLRWVEVAPDGKSVVYQALGHLWIRDLPSGKPRRLTRDDDVHEFYPSFSRDSQRIAYVAYDADGLGSLRVVPRRGGKGRTITAKPGHYREPAWSPDSNTIVYRKTSGGPLLSPKWSHDPGLYAVSSRGGTPWLVTRSGSDPHFGADSERVFFLDTIEEKDDVVRVLSSISLRGAEPRAHIKSENATLFRVSPDGKWVAWKELFKVYVAPFPATGRTFDVGPKGESLPIAAVSRDAGEYVHWAGNSRRIYWALGPELYARDLKEAFAFIDGAPEKPLPPPEKGTDIGFDVDAFVPKGKVALVNGRIVTMKGGEVIEGGTVLVEGNRIAAVGKNIEVPRDATTIDVSGMTVIPGLVDVHAHGSQGEDGITPQQNWLHYSELGFGVTTVHDPSNDTAEVFSTAEMARAGELVAPRIFSTGTILYGAKGTYTAKVESLDDARGHLRRMKAVGAFSVKSYNQPRRNQRQQVLAAARELDMLVVPEGGSTFMHNMNMIVDGHTGIEHAIPVAKAYRDVTQLWSGTKVGYTPTIGVGYGGLSGEYYWYAHTNVFEHERLKAFVPPFAYETRARRRTLASRGDWNHIRIAKLCKQLLDAGVEVHLGAHGQREGLAAHWELWSFVQGGMTPHEALRAGTILGANYLSMGDEIGSIEPGKLADIAVIEGNPLANIRESDRVRYTMVNGQLYDARTITELNGPKRKPRPFYWQSPGGATRPSNTATHH
jgi:imidazolonepropionase-like amidohydrolase/Tol biopolymer transport system component